MSKAFTRRRGDAARALAWAALAWSLVGTLPEAAAQPAGKVPRIGFVAGVIPMADLEKGRNSSHPYVAAFAAGLESRGWKDGVNVRVVWRAAEGRYERQPGFARELAAMPVDVIVAFGTGVDAAARATRDIPIVMGSHYYPLRFARSLAHPGGNVTGLTGVLDQEEGTPKRVSLLKAAAPGLSRIAWITQARGELADRFVEAPGRHVAAAAELRVDVLMLTFGDPATLDAVIDSAVRQGAQAIMLDDVAPLHLPQYQRSTAAHAVRHRIPLMVPVVNGVQEGALIAYGPDVAANYSRLGYFIDRILRGEKPGDIPIEQPSRYELHVNTATAKAIGLELPRALLLQADRVIQ